ncbi:NADP-dependent oxidoreductase domain-containing protein [Fomitopsis serialis]|uniref:NADP-dependent oxidoreductase domain-containing protein n=1 Tax=Fomitopsis serialis TaxID=139415 RepID=UPI0020081466|nr:NADP-dependent oxidoreductase domain-containing protein [Neoantrodia serialis]KAH9915678.1 NADP-dependent oxidoreductase domain-containing protein [Neoantrodia serialis]
MAAALESLSSSVRLSSGYTIPVLGFGVAFGFDKAGRDPRTLTKPAVLEALKVGLRHFDTARMYNNEDHLGEVIKESGIPREELFITTKVDGDFHGYDKTVASVNDSLKRLDLDFADLILLHDARAGKRRRLEAYKALLDLKAQGKVRSAGVSNYGVKHLEEIAAAGYEVPSVNQLEIHPFCQQRPIVEYCKAHNITVEAYCPLVRGRVDNPVVGKIASRLGKDPAQVLIRWSLQRGFIPLPMSSSPARIKSNADVFNFSLPESDMAGLDALDQGGAGAISWNPVDVE